MLFKILKIAIIFILPFVIYAIWAYFARRRATAGEEQFQDTPWIWLAMAGMVLAIIGIMTTTLWIESTPPTALHGPKTTQSQ